LQIKELAEIVGVTPGTVINWELGGSQPRGRKIRKRIRRLIKVPVVFEENLEEKKAVKK
jgi:transcriptional regulator with XRE-family HTH domain